ncbi:MAG: hypothetical protein OES26_20020 [Gammaproteobacteria bacterium]|nr:hypothetical protein [Gammaproteobacteria bacterium]
MLNIPGWKLAILGFLVLSLTGCAALHRVRPQALTYEDEDLSSIEYNLVLMSIDLHQRDTNLRLRRLVVKNLDTQEFWVSVFFYNAVIGSNEITYTLTADATKYLIFLDIPAGNYQLTHADFAHSRYGSSGGTDTRVLEDELGQTVRFEVLEGEQTYIGNLKIQIAAATIVGSEAKTPSILLADTSLWDSIPGLRQGMIEASKGTIETLGGVLVYSTPGAPDTDLEKAMEEYPALKGVNFSRRALWIEE